MIVKVCAAPRKTKGNNQKTGCFDANGKEIEYGEKVLMSGFCAHCGDDASVFIDEQEIIPQKLEGESGFEAKIHGGKVYFSSFNGPINVLHVIEHEESHCFDKNGNPIYIGSYLCFYPESVKLFGYVIEIESCYLIFNTEFGTARIEYDQGERLDCQIVR